MSESSESSDREEFECSICIVDYIPAAIIADNVDTFETAILNGYCYRFEDILLMIQHRSMRILQMCNEHFELVGTGEADEEVDISPQQIKELVNIARPDREIFNMIRNWWCAEHYYAFQEGDVNDAGDLKRWEEF